MWRGRAVMAGGHDRRAENIADLERGIDLIPLPLSLVQCGLLVVVVTLACGIGPALTVKRLAPGLTHRGSIRGRHLSTWAPGQWLVRSASRRRRRRARRRVFVAV
jgi:hypothetical protein